MAPALAYSPKPGPLGAARPSIAALYLAPLAVGAFAFSNPLVLAGLAMAVALVSARSGASAAVRGVLRYGAYLALMIVVINGLASQRGETILVRGWDVPVIGQLDISAEALAEGGVLAARILVVIAISAIWSACVNPDRLVRALRPYAGRSALTATLVSRMVPLAAADGTRLAEAAKLRGPAAAPVGRVEILRRLVSGALDRSVDVAATLELRGYGLDRAVREPRSTPSGTEWRLLAAGLFLGLALGLALAEGVAGFDAYPRIEIATDGPTLVLAVILPVLAVLPWALSGKRRSGRSTAGSVVIGG